MANCNPPVKNQAFDLGFTLYKSDGSVIANPGTLTAKISKDFGDYADIGTTSEEDTTYGQMKAALTATEMNADVVMLYIKDDTAGCVPFTATIYTCSATRGLAGTALPNAAADGAGGLPISDAGGLDLDTYIKRLEAAFTSTIAGYIDAAISTRAPEDGGNVAGLVTTVGAAGAGLTAITGAKLHADYDAAKTAASQTSVNDIPTNTELATALGDIPTADENADALIGRNVAGGSSTGRLIKDVFRLLRNKVAISSGTMTVYAEDDSTPAWTASTTGTAGADPITAIDPA